LITAGDSTNQSTAQGAALRLCELLGAERVEQLAELVEEVTRETGYGNITIIVSQGRVARLKAEKSY